MAKIQIRYNSKSDGVTDKWMVYVDDTAFLFNDILLDGKFYTEITMAEYGELKHNISTVHGSISFNDGLAVITNQPRKKQYYIITGLPRSRTAWFSGLLSTGRSICFHEPKSQFGSWDNFYDYTQALDYDFIGISDSSLSIDPDFKLEKFGNAKMVIILRNADDAIDSFSDFLGLPITESTDLISSITRGLAKWIDRGLGTIADYDSLNHESVIKEIWQVCLPDITFEPTRVMIFQNLLINQHIEKALTRAGLT